MALKLKINFMINKSVVKTNKLQPNGYYDDELELIKNTFSENTELLIALKNFFLQLPLNLEEKLLLALFKNNKDLMDLMEKMFLPTLDKDVPIGQTTDLWMSVDTSNNPELIEQHLIGRKIIIDYFSQKLFLLNAGNLFLGKDDIMFKDLMENSDNKIARLIAHNTIITYVNQTLVRLKVWSGLKKETAEETIERLKKDSSK